MTRLVFIGNDGTVMGNEMAETDVVSFSDKPSPFQPVPLSKIPVSVLKQAVMDIRKNKQVKGGSASPPAGKVADGR